MGWNNLLALGVFFRWKIWKVWGVGCYSLILTSKKNCIYKYYFYYYHFKIHFFIFSAFCSVAFSVFCRTVAKNCFPGITFSKKYHFFSAKNTAFFINRKKNQEIILTNKKYFAIISVVVHTTDKYFSFSKCVLWTNLAVLF